MNKLGNFVATTPSCQKNGKRSLERRTIAQVRNLHLHLKKEKALKKEYIKVKLKHISHSYLV